MLFKWFSSDTWSEFGLRISEQAVLLYNYKYVRRVSILLARDILPLSLSASWICFEQYFCILWRWFSSPVRLLWYCYINNTIVLLWAGGCMIWRQWYWRYDVTCTFFSRSIVSTYTSIHVQNSTAGFICPPWAVTDLAVAFNCVFWSSVNFTSKFVRMCRLFSDSGFEYPSACAVRLFNYDSVYTGNISKIIESRSMR